MEATRTTRLSGRRRLPRQMVKRTVVHMVLLTASFVAVAPFVWTFFGSFKPFKELVSSRALLPQSWTLANYEAIISRVNFICRPK